MANKPTRKWFSGLSPDPQAWIMVGLLGAAMILLFGFGNAAGAVICLVFFIFLMAILGS